MPRDHLLVVSLFAFISGVALGSFAGQSVLYLGCLVAASALALWVVFRMSWLFGGILGAGMFVFGGWFTEQALQAERGLPEQITVVGTARIVLLPEEKSFYRDVRLRLEECEGDGAECPQALVLWQAPKTFPLPAGARFPFTCALERPENFTPDFDYRMFLMKEGVGYICKQGATGEPLPTDWQGRLRAALYAPKLVLDRAFAESLSEPESSLGRGLLLGGSSGLPEDLREAFKHIGLSHIVAVSGFNITLIAQGFLYLSLALGLWRRQALWVAAIGIVLFILMIGAPASAVRAGVMALFAFFAMQSGRLSQSFGGLLLAAGLMLLYNPLLLRYDIGFQLSFVATLAIILAAPWREVVLRRVRLGKMFVEIALLTLSIECFVVPLLLIHFGAFSPVALFANVLILPLVPIVMGLAFFGVLLYLLFPATGSLFLAPAYGVLFLIVRLAEWLGAIPWASVPVSFWNGYVALGWYIFLFSGMVWWKKYRSRKQDLPL